MFMKPELFQISDTNITNHVPKRFTGLPVCHNPAPVCHYGSKNFFGYKEKIA